MQRIVENPAINSAPVRFHSLPPPLQTVVAPNILYPRIALFEVVSTKIKDDTKDTEVPRAFLQSIHLSASKLCPVWLSSVSHNESRKVEVAYAPWKTLRHVHNQRPIPYAPDGPMDAFLCLCRLRFEDFSDRQHERTSCIESANFALPFQCGSLAQGIVRQSSGLSFDAKDLMS